METSQVYSRYMLSESVKDTIKTVEYALFTVGGFLLGALQVAGVVDMQLAVVLLVVVGGFIVARQTYTKWAGSKSVESTVKTCTISSLAIAAIFGGVYYYVYVKKTEQDRKALELQKNQEAQLANLEFRAASASKLKTADLNIELDRPYNAVELAHFRAMFEVSNCPGATNRPSFSAACKEFYQSVQNELWNRVGTECMAWSGNAKSRIAIGTTKYSNQPTAPRIGVGASLSEHGITSFPTVGDLNETCLFIYVTENLLPKIRQIAFQVNNEYELIYAPATDLFAIDEDPANCALPISTQQKATKWKRIDLKFDGKTAIETLRRQGLPTNGRRTFWELDFIRLTPRKIKHELD